MNPVARFLYRHHVWTEWFSFFLAVLFIIRSTQHSFPLRFAYLFGAGICVGVFTNVMRRRP